MRGMWRWRGKGMQNQCLKNISLKKLLSKALKTWNKVYKQYGPCKIKPKDIPDEANFDDVEFRHEGYKNEAGDIYVGEFRKGTNIREGRGLLISWEGYMYEGFWVDDMRFGFGRMLINNGCAFQGDWKNDKSEGKGVYYSNNGLKYKGEWKNNKCHGKGFEKYSDGSKFKGYFENGEKSGKGVFKWADGKEYKGAFKKGCMEGMRVIIVAGIKFLT